MSFPALRPRRRWQPVVALGRPRPSRARDGDRRLVPRAQGQRGWPAERLMPLLAGLLELVPWLCNGTTISIRLRDCAWAIILRTSLTTEARELGMTEADLRAWTPPAADAADASPEGDGMTLLRELIDIPERVQTGDFVLKLSEGVTEAEAAATIRSYVVTPQLATAFDKAMGFIQGSVANTKSAACYLHGSFGSGKSHFMAVLNLLLAGEHAARSVVELAPVVDRHDAWLTGKRFLMVPFHMIGARDVESAILGGYAEHVRRIHPDAPTPGFYLGERLLDDARSLRITMGEDAFFAGLNEGMQRGGDGWGDLGGDWTVASFEAAALEPPEGEERQRLVGDLIATYFKSYADVAATRGEAFVDLDAGLAIMSHHAKRLGYDAVVLFLDELILWLASRAGDVNFVSSEGAKLSKLVEAQRSDRPIPIISFVARQRDLRELIGEHQAGALEMRFLDTLRYWEARFDRITLEDRNLPVIAQKRLLAPTSETARQQMDAAFDEFAGRRRDVLETLLGSDGERDLFRKTYPFSPALVQALVAASSALQRERTALKLMLTLLVKRRDDLKLGDLIPVGDLWDEIAAGDQPFSAGMRIQFDNAKKLWSQKLLPLLEQTHNVTWQDLQDGRADPQIAKHFRNDARLLKTLLLSALVPEVPALRALTAPRLAALNHGSVVSPIPGHEGGLVLQKLRRWASSVGEIRLSEDAVPIVSLQITGVDVAPILANAQQYDNDGTRRSRSAKDPFRDARQNRRRVAARRTALCGTSPSMAGHEPPGRSVFRSGERRSPTTVFADDKTLRCSCSACHSTRGAGCRSITLLTPMPFVTTTLPAALCGNPPIWAIARCAISGR